MQGCGDYGIPVFDTTEGRLRVYFFLVQTGGPKHQVPENHYDAILSCIQQNGVSGCYHLATEWTDALTPVR